MNPDASAVRGRASLNAPNTLAAGKTGNDFVASLDVAWQIDLFGRLRNITAAANARAQGSAADLGALNLSLQAELATDYFTLRGDDATVKLLEDSVAQFDTAWEQTKRRYDTGVSAATDLDQADTLRQNARAQLAATRLARAHLEHAIAVLIGLPPSVFHPGAGAAGRRAAADQSGTALGAAGTPSGCGQRGTRSGRGQCRHRGSARRLVPGVLAAGRGGRL